MVERNTCAWCLHLWPRGTTSACKLGVASDLPATHTKRGAGGRKASEPACDRAALAPAPKGEK